MRVITVLLYLVLIMIGTCTMALAKTGDILIEDPLDGSIVPGWRTIPESYIRLPDHGMVYNLEPAPSSYIKHLPWVGDQSWKYYRIEIEFMIKEGENRGFIGLQFHVQEDSVMGNNIGLYTGGKLPSERWLETSVHYNQDNLSWKLWPFSQKSFRLEANKWNKLRIDVGESIANAFVNNDTVPVYTTYALPFATGGVRFWQYGGSGYFKNLRITDLSDEEIKPILADVWDSKFKLGVLDKWKISPLLAPDTQIDTLPPQISQDQIEWQSIPADQRGLINFSAFFPDNNQHHLVFARSYVSVSSGGTAYAYFSYTDRANVWCNGKLVFEGSARGWYDKDGQSAADGFGRLLPNLFKFPVEIEKGENVIIVGLEIKEPQFGSGFYMRLRDY